MVVDLGGLDEGPRSIDLFDCFLFLPFNIVFFLLFGFMRRTMPDSSVEGLDEWTV